MLYKKDPNWIAPLKLDQKALFNPKKNISLGHCDYQFFLLFEKKKLSGRIAVYIDEMANDYWQKKFGRSAC